MPQQLLTSEEFLAKLGECFSDPSSSKSVSLTHKRLTYSEDEDVKMADEEAELNGESPEYEVLLRAVHGDDKFSTRILASSLPSFHAAYGALLKNGMAPLMRRRDKKKEKARAEALAKKRKELYVDVVVGNEGKRGAGKRQRTRKIAAQKKKEVERERLEARQGEQKSGVEI
ncbi:hypothetical protein IAT38_006960 [Cryptococcus sp. DSM 104549]